ncbi:invasion protein IalB [Bradyrhizobium sp. USDA 4369]
MMTGRPRLSASLALAIVATTPTGQAFAGERKPTAQSAEVAIRGQREATDITYGSWRKLCFQAGGAPPLCRTSITGRFPTGQMAVRLDLIERDDDQKGRLQLFVPVGMYLQHPVKLTVDRGRSYQVPYTWCLSNACIASDVADHALVKEMELGKTLVLEVVDANLLSLTTSLPLPEFGPAHRGPPQQTFEQDIDE